jgi:hypothetical protein
MGECGRARPALWRSLRLLGKASSAHYLAATGFYFTTIPLFIVQLFNWIPALAATPIAPMVVGEWSFVYRMLMLVSFIPLIITWALNFFIVQKLLAPEQDIRWYHNLKWLLELLIVFPAANLIYATIPTLICVVKAMFTENFVHIPSAKPQAQVDTA